MKFPYNLFGNLYFMLIIKHYLALKEFFYYFDGRYLVLVAYI